MLQIYNSLTQKKSEFKPLVPGRVSIYVCGMTVYDYCHVGHARSLIVFDMIVRYLRAQGLQVNFVRNITDIDDKIIRRAQEKGVDSVQLSQDFIDAFHEDEASLNVISPDHEPRATEYVDQIITFIQTLIDKDFAYVTENGDVNFVVKKFKEYGKLSHRDVEKLISGARVAVDQSKRDPLDFVLWKPAKPGEPSWSSPWGDGRPGWHIECSAMSNDLLGQPFDIHGGGLDLKFPHHENEIAQSEAAHSCDFVKTWMHAGLVQINDEKMSKSLGNFFTIREVLAQYPAEVLRYFMLAAHYRSPVNYSKENLDAAQQALTRFYTALRELPVVSAAPENKYQQAFQKVMNDDFNTPEALAVLFDMAREINRLKEKSAPEKAAALGAQLRELAGVLGILQLDAETFLQGQVDVAAIDALIAEREQARRDKNWALSDEIRDRLAVMDIIIEDAAQGTKWRRKH